jgi:hypothetical protein
MIKKIGSGAFGEIYKGKIKEMIIVVIQGQTLKQEKRLQ